jgi:hypothetical protein
MNTTQQTESPLPASIEMRALAHMAKGVEAIEAVKLAFQEEENTIWLAAHGVDMETGRMRTDVQKELMQQMSKRVYNRINNIS